MYSLFVLVLKSSVIEFKMLKCIYKPNASSSWELEQFLLFKDSSGQSAIRENYSRNMSGIQIASFISKLFKEGHAHERWKEIKKVKVLGKSVHLLPLPKANISLHQARKASSIKATSVIYQHSWLTRRSR